MPANSEPSPSVPDRVRDDLWATLKQDWRYVRDESRPGWRQQFDRTIAELQEFYLTPINRQRLTTARGPERWILIAWWLLRALLLKLTPTRRVVLVVALLCLWFGDVTLRSGDVRVQFDLTPFSTLMLIGVLLLELRDKLLAHDELRAGRAVQQALMPGHGPALADWDVWMYSRPANDVGGDLVDSLELSPGRVGLALCDVAGKALPAALLMAKVQSTLRALATDTRSLGELAARTNDILCRDGLPNRFATLVYLDVREGSRTVRLLNAGHMPPVHVSGSSFHQLPLGNLALGLMPGVAYVEQSVDVSDGDLLVIYSDGLTEALNESGDFFGDERLQPLLAQLSPLSARAAGAHLLAAVDRFIGECRPYDDLSLIILKKR